MDIRNLISQMTLEEKAGMLNGLDFWHLKGVERLGIPSVMVSDGPHGLRKQAESADHLGLNESVPLPPEFAELIGVEELEADMLWRGLGPRKDRMLAVEYDGKDYHTDDRQRSYDNIRRTLLRNVGVEVITVDKWQLYDMALLDGIMQIVSEAVGGPTVRQDTKARAARMALRGELLAPGANPYKLLIP